MSKMTRVIAVFLGLALAGCAGGYDIAHENVVDNVARTSTWDAFGYCGGWGCSDHRDTGFTQQEWSEVAAHFSPGAQSAEQERQQIAHAIGAMEGFIGAKTGYDRDKGGTGGGIFQSGQLDCYSEAANTSSFLHLLNNAGLLRYHVPAEPIMRGIGSSKSWRPTHATATMTEFESGTRIAMDSWFYDNGTPAVYVEADTWAGAWGPDEGGAHF